MSTETATSDATTGVRGAVAGENPLIGLNKGEVFTSFDVEAFEIPSGREETWRFTPMRRLRGLHKGEVGADAEPTVTVDSAPEGVQVETVGRDDARLGTAGVPADRVTAQAYSAFASATVVTIGREQELSEPVMITLSAPGEGKGGYGHLQLRAERHSRGVVVIDQVGSGTYAENVEVITEDGAHLSVVIIQDFAEDAVVVSGHHIRVGRDATVDHYVATFGGDLVRINPRVTYDGPGGSAKLFGVYYADAGQHFEQHLLVDHEPPHCRSNVVYKGALQGAPGSGKPDARTVWVGDVLIRADAEGTDTYEINRNLVLSDGARADSVPNLEIETGEIAGAGHASTTGRFDDEQLFYLRSRGIPEVEARKLVVRGFFQEIIAAIPVEQVRERLTATVDEELAASGS